MVFQPIVVLLNVCLVCNLHSSVVRGLLHGIRLAYTMHAIAIPLLMAHMASCDLSDVDCGTRTSMDAVLYTVLYTGRNQALIFG